MEASGFLSGGDAAGASAVPTTTTTTTVLEVPATIEENAAADLSSMPAVGAFNPSPFQSVENFVTFATDEAEVEIEQEGNVATFASASVPATPRVSVTWAATEVESIDAVTDAVTEYVPPSEVPSVVAPSRSGSPLTGFRTKPASVVTATVQPTIPSQSGSAASTSPSLSLSTPSLHPYPGSLRGFQSGALRSRRARDARGLPGG